MPPPDGHSGPTGPPAFPLGRLVATPAALAALTGAGVSHLALLDRHARGDWGDLCEEDLQLNALALIKGLRLLSSYRLPDGSSVWIITEADRSATTVLTPAEY